MKKYYIKPKFQELNIDLGLCVGSEMKNCTQFDLNIQTLNKKKTKTFLIDEDYEEYWNHNF